MEGIHVRDEVKALYPIKHISTQSRRAFHTVTWGLVLYMVEIPSTISNMDSPRTQKMLSSIASLHTRTGSQYVSNILAELLTSESFQIRCECATNEEPEGEDLHK